MTSTIEQQEMERSSEEEEAQQPHWAVTKLFQALPYILSIGDSTVFVFEFLFINTLIQLFLSTMSFYNQNNKTPTSVYTCYEKENGFKNILTCTLRNDYFTLLANVGHVFTWTCLTIAYFVWRYKIDVKRMRKWRLSKTAVFVLFLCVVGVITLYTIQDRTGKWIYKTSNMDAIVTTEEPITTNVEVMDDIDSVEDVIAPNVTVHQNVFIDYGRVLHLVFAAPLIEEVVLRIGLTTVIQRRLQTVMSSIIWTNIIFSGLHIVNAVQHASSSYTLFQVFGGLLFGTFYSTRLYITGNLLESLALHIANNIAAIWIPITLTWKDVVPDFIAPIVITQLIYIVLLIRDFRIIRKVHASLGTNEEENDQASITTKTKTD